MNKVIIGKHCFFCEDGAVLSDVLIDSGIELSHPCSGHGICKKCQVLINGRTELSCQYKVYSDTQVFLPEEKNIASENGLPVYACASDEHCFILDIGTTTIALALIDTKNGSAVKIITENNPQCVYGADVISRIEASQKYGEAALQKVLIDKINKMLLCFPDNNARTLYIAGNTVMLHLFFGISPCSIGIFPYTPVFLEGKKCRGGDIGIKSIDNIQSLPCISSFVGADIVAGLLSVNPPKKNSYSLLVDLGTNAEIVLFSQDEILCSSAAAGPCFEGVGISYGMSAADGAIYEYRSDSDFSVIGHRKAKGICSTGLIDIIAVLLRKNIIDETGYMEEESFRITEGIFLSRRDIRQFQNSKSAIYSAIETLLGSRNISSDDIEALYISGGFSSKLNIENAVITGIFPKELKEKCIPLKNSCLQGLMAFSCSDKSLTELTKKAEYIDLANNTAFSDSFINNMFFNTF